MAGFSSFDDIECHFKWKPEIGRGKEIKELIDSLEWKKVNEPWLGGLHRLTLAYLHTLPGFADLVKANAYLLESTDVAADESDPLPLNVDFLHSAMKLRLEMLEWSPIMPSALSQQLSDLSEQWKSAAVQAECWIAKGWLLLSFGPSKYNDAQEAFERAEPIATAAEGMDKFHMYYGLAFVKSRLRRLANHSSEVAKMELGHWKTAIELLKNSGKKQPVFLARFAAAILNSDPDKCQTLAEESDEQAAKREKFYDVYDTRGVQKVLGLFHITLFNSQQE